MDAPNRSILVNLGLLWATVRFDVDDCWNGPGTPIISFLSRKAGRMLFRICNNSDQNKMMLRLSEHHFMLVSKSHNCKRMLR
jgi:hypothetical protein